MFLFDNISCLGHFRERHTGFGMMIGKLLEVMTSGHWVQ